MAARRPRGRAGPGRPRAARRRHATTPSTRRRWRSRSPARWPSRTAYEKAEPVLLEPIMELEVTVPDDAVGAVNGDLNSRRGRLQGMEPRGGHDDDQRRGADGRDAHLLAVAHVDDGRPRRLPHGVPALRGGPGPHRPEAHRADEERARRGRTRRALRAPADREDSPARGSQPSLVLGCGWSLPRRCRIRSSMSTSSCSRSRW